jgi:hypothetical protein
MLTNQQKVIIGLGAASLLPIFRSGLVTHMNFWQWVYNHTIWGPPVEYIPEEDYKTELCPTSIVRRS